MPAEKRTAACLMSMLAVDPIGLQPCLLTKENVMKRLKRVCLTWLVAMMIVAAQVGAAPTIGQQSTKKNYVCTGLISQNTTCSCSGYPTGGCDAGTASFVFYHYCESPQNPDPNVCPTCTETWRKVGQSWQCELNTKWSIYIGCLGLAAGCGVICASPPWIQCAICLAAVPACAGCNVVDCEEKPGTRTNVLAWDCG